MCLKPVEKLYSAFDVLALWIVFGSRRKVVSPNFTHLGSKDFATKGLGGRTWATYFFPVTCFSVFMHQIPLPYPASSSCFILLLLLCVARVDFGGGTGRRGYGLYFAVIHELIVRFPNWLLYDQQTKTVELPKSAFPSSPPFTPFIP